MKKLLIALVAIFAVAGVQASCCVREPKVCPQATCPKPVKPCAKRCPRVSKCPRCPRVNRCSLCGNNENMQAEMEAGINDDLDILGRVADTTDAAVSGAVNVTEDAVGASGDVVGSALGSEEYRDELRQERRARRDERRARRGGLPREERRAQRAERVRGQSESVRQDYVRASSRGRASRGF